MLISHRYRFIYVKTFKTAGTSVESYLEPCCMCDGEWVQSHAREEYVSDAGIIGYRGSERPHGCTWWNHMPAALIRQRIGDTVWNSYFKFCNVRNPYTTAVSAFYFRDDDAAPVGDGGAPEAERFERWLERLNFRAFKDHYLMDGRFCLDAVVRFEHMADDLKAMCDRVGIAWEPHRLPHFKKGIRPPSYRIEDLYTERSKAIVRDACAFELDYFGYSFPATD